MSGSGKATAWDNGFEVAGFIWFASMGLDLDDVAKILQKKCRPSVRRTKAELESRLNGIAKGVYNPDNGGSWDRDKANYMIKHMLQTKPVYTRFLSMVALTDEEKLSFQKITLPVGDASVQLTLPTTATAGGFGMAAMSTTLSQIEGSMTATSGSNALQRHLPEDEEEDEDEDEDKDEDENEDEDDGFDRPQFDGLNYDVTKQWKRKEQWEMATMVSYAKSWKYRISPHFAHKGPKVAFRRWQKIKNEPEYAWAEETKALVLKQGRVKRGEREDFRRQVGRQTERQAVLKERIEESQQHAFDPKETALQKRMRESVNRPYGTSDAEGAQGKRPRRQCNWILGERIFASIPFSAAQSLVCELFWRSNSR